MFELTPGGEHSYWMSFIHTFSTLGSDQLVAGVGLCHVAGAEDLDSISNMPSIRSSWTGKRTLRFDNEPVTSNTWKTQLRIWITPLIMLQTHPLILFFFFHSLIHL